MLPPRDGQSQPRGALPVLGGQGVQQGAVDALDAAAPIGKRYDSGQLCGQMAEGIH